MSSGCLSAVNWNVSPFNIFIAEWLTVIPVNGLFTVITELASNPAHVAITVAVPEPTAVTTPSSTVTTEVSLDTHLIFSEFPVFVGSFVAVNWYVFPLLIVAVSGFNVNPVIAGPPDTVI